MYLLFLRILNYLVISAGLIGSLGYLSQAYKIVKTKSVKSVSLFTYIVFLFICIIYTAYGVVYHKTEIIISNVIILFADIIVLLLYFLYRNNNHYCDNCHKLFADAEEYHRVKLKHPHVKK